MSIVDVARVVVGALVLAVGAVPVHADGAPAARDEARDGVIVRVEEGVDPALVAGEVVDSGERVDEVFEEAANGFAGRLSAAAVEQLRADARVAAVEPDHPIEAFNPQTGVRRIGADEYAPAGIGTNASTDVDIAVFDTGIDGAHPDLRVVGGVDCRSGSCTQVASPTDPHGHGTHVAGIAAAHDDGVGVVGVAPGARLHSVRVLGADGEGRLSSLIAGLEWLVTNADRIEVANLSLGCECQSTSLNDAVRAVNEAGVTLVVAAGNAGRDAAGFSPANHPDTVTVGAISDYDGRPGGLRTSGCIADVDDSFASYSNHGAMVDLNAPGSCIISTWPDGAYARTSGTSMAAPHAAGAAAVYIATAEVARSSPRPGTVRQQLVGDFSVASTHECGYTGSASTAPMLHLSCVDSSGNTAPTLAVTAPSDGLTVLSGTTVPLRANAHDGEDGDLDDSIAWSSSRTGWLGTGPAIDVQLSELGDHTIVALVTDSSGATDREARLVRVTDENGSTGDATEDDPSVPEEPEPDDPPTTIAEPQLTIVAPVPDSRIVADRDVQLTARAVDHEDGDLRALVQWRSDRDGPLGVGGTVGAQLSAGWHRITATVTDDGHRSERTATIRVADAADLDSRSITGACPPEQVVEGGFADVGDNVHADAIDCVTWWRIARGTSDVTYDPARPVTRGQMATFLAQAIQRSGGELPEADRDHFDDDDGTTHEANINRLAAAGIVRGTGERTFDPNGEVTRAQMGSFLVATYQYRAALPLPGIQERFSDVAGTHAPNINAIAAAGITGGVQPDRYAPGRAVRRDQMASFIARTLDVLVDMNAAAPPPPS
jgi:subtilisin family serine protease